MLNTLRSLKQQFRRAFQSRFVKLTAGAFAPMVGPYCHFEYPRRIYVGSDVVFFRGAMVSADPAGEIRLEDGVRICQYAQLASLGGVLRIGPNSAIGDFCSLTAQGGIDIGANVMIAAGVRIMANSHTFKRTDTPIAFQPCICHGIHIRDGAWIGTNAVVLDGINIGTGAIVGAGAVVTKNVPDFAIVVGAPARLIRMRDAVPPGSSQGEAHRRLNG